MQPNKQKGISRQQSLMDYDGFLARMNAEQPKTTDDCYTPETVYECIKDYAVKRFGLEGRRIVRPFWPGADYTAFDYQEGDVVIDNPPFSITAQILDFYIANKIDFFLFCPGLTPGSTVRRGLSLTIINHAIIYENGAAVATAFTTNLDKVNAIVCDGVLSEKLKDLQVKVESKAPRKIGYPAEVVTAARLRPIARGGVVFALPFVETQLTPEKVGKPGIKVFGKGYYISRPAAKAAALAAIRAAAKADALAANAIPVELRPEEEAVIALLDAAHNPDFDYTKY